MLPTILLSTALFATANAGPTAQELEPKVAELFDEWCTACHSGAPAAVSDSSELGLESPLSSMVGLTSVDAAGKPLVVPGDPDASYLVAKLTGQGIEGDIMPMGDDPLPPEQVQIVKDWIAALPTDDGSGAAGAGDGGTEEGGGDTGTEGGGTTTGGGTVTTGGAAAAAKPKGRKPFHGTSQIVLPTTTTLGKKTLQYRIDHRFGRIGAERGAFGLDGGVVMAMGMQYGILDGWDVMLRRSNSRKTWELGTKFIGLRQEDDRPLSVGAYASVEYLRAFDVANRWTGNFQAMVSRLWFDRWSTMLTLGYHLRTNHNARVIVDRGDGPEPVEDKRDTMVVGFASTVWLGKRKKWGIDLEYFLPIPDGSEPNRFYYRGGDADTAGSSIGSWALGGSYYTGKHFFQVFFTNNREITTGLAAPGGQSGNPFDTEGVDSNNPFHKFNFFLGFNLGRRFTLGKRIEKRRKAKAAKAEGGGK